MCTEINTVFVPHPTCYGNIKAYSYGQQYCVQVCLAKKLNFCCNTMSPSNTLPWPFKHMTAHIPGDDFVTTTSYFYFPELQSYLTVWCLINVQTHGSGLPGSYFITSLVPEGKFPKQLRAVFGLNTQQK